MADKTLTIVSKSKEITFYDLDEDKEMEIEIEEKFRGSISFYLNSDNLISLRDHIDYLLKKLESDE